MTAVASPPAFPQLSRPAWGSIDGNNSMNPDEARGMFAPRKPLSRTNSSGSISSTSSNSSASTVLTNGSQASSTPVSTTSDLSQWSANTASRKRPRNQPWPSKGEPQPDFSRLPAGRPNGMVPQQGLLQSGGQVQMAPQGQVMRPVAAEQLPPGQPVLYLLSLNGTFERKTIGVPFSPESLRIGRQTNQKTIPTATNGFFDSKVLSRQHAEIFAERNGKIFIRDVKSSNGTFVNGTRLSQENRESEPHELSTGDHLELGIDIVSEDQKTVVHHKVAAKVEHSGFMSNSNNVMDMNFGDLDPANSAMMTPGGAVQARGRTGSNASMGPNNNRMMANPGMNPQSNMPQQRPFFLSPIATDQILKRLSNEMRSARLQAQDLGRTSSFVNTLLSKNDVKDLEKPEAPEPPKAHLNGGIPFRPDPKTRFSEPPAPPPQQPLPEKPNTPGLKKGATERAKSGPPEVTSPVRHENVSQIVQLTEALNNAKREADSQHARMRELELLLQREREARELAETLAKRLEENASSHVNGAAIGPPEPAAVVETVKEVPDAEDNGASETTVVAEVEPAVDAVALQTRLDTMDEQMVELKGQLESWKQRCEAAEAERDADRKTLAEMVVQLRAEEAQRVAAQKERRSRSRHRRTEGTQHATDETSSADTAEAPAIQQSDGNDSSDMIADEPTLSRANTITPNMSKRSGPLSNPQQLQAGLPYASALGVVLVGMGLMAYMNGWQAPPSPIDHR